MSIPIYKNTKIESVKLTKHKNKVESLTTFTQYNCAYSYYNLVFEFE